MTNEEAIAIIRNEYKCVDRDCYIERSCGKCDLMMPNKEPILEAYKLAIKALEQQTCDDAISRQAVIKGIEELKKSPWATANRSHGYEYLITEALDVVKDLCVKQLPSVTQKSGKCKNCKYFEYDSVAKVDGIPLIVAHEICNKWGDGCKTSEDGYCYLFEPQESEDKTE